MRRDARSADWRALHGSFFEGQRALVTGGAGFIGSHLAEALAGLGARVRVLDDLSAGARSAIAAFPGVELVEGSVLDAAAAARSAAGCRFVFHLAALVSVPESAERPARYHEVNAEGTRIVLEAARAARASRVLFAGSSSVYGDGPEAVKAESLRPAPQSPYAETKLAGEEHVRAFGEDGRIDTVTLRYFNVFGPGQRAESAYAAVVPAFARRLLGGERPIVHGDGEQSRDFAFVANVVHANLLAARHDGLFRGAAINIGSGEGTTVNDLARAMARLLGRPELEPLRGPERPGDVRHSVADVSRAREVLGYAPLVSLDDGLRIVLRLA
jgi:nucleoside-diphosphate-sugar epimerase